jgi:hypothetical protein
MDVSLRSFCLNQTYHLIAEKAADISYRKFTGNTITQKYNQAQESMHSSKDRKFLSQQLSKRT